MSTPWPRFALRSIRRHRRRSLLVMLAMAAGLFVLIFLKGLQDGFVDQRLEQGLGMMTGHARVEPAEEARTLADTAALLDVLRATPGVVGASARLRGQALARSLEGNSGVVFLGVDPLDEAAATVLPSRLVLGSFLEEPPLGGSSPAALGTELATRLGVGLDDRITLLAEGHDGSLFAEAFRVTGLFETGGQALDGGFVYLRRGDARRLLAAEGDATGIVLRLEEPRDARALADRLAEIPALAGTRVLSWHETAPEVLSAMETLRVMERLRNLVLFVLVGLGILNAVVMSVFERRREFGVLLALGLRPSAIVRLLVWEVGLLAVLGIAAGVGSGWLVTDVWLGSRGLDVFALGARLPGALEGSSVIYPAVSLANVLGASAWVGALALLVIAWPARAILRLDPADVLRGRD
jgi:ABC-type lipoprotein release transport system permease subunit